MIRPAVCTDGGPSVQAQSSTRPSLDYGTKLARPSRAGWRLALYPEAGEASAVFVSGAGPSSASSVDRSPGSSDEVAAVATRRARSAIRRYCAANRLTYLWTLTYGGQGQHDPTGLRCDLRSFFRRLRRHSGEPIPYLWAPEWHPEGHGLHVHFAVDRYVAHGAIASLWGHGFCFVRGRRGARGRTDLDQARHVARYVSKYVAKDLGTGVLPGLHRYEVAQGFQPRRIVLRGESAVELVERASELMGAAPERVWLSRRDEEWVGPPVVWAGW
jgi:hypothetical protein